MQVALIRADHHGSGRASDQHDRGIDHIGGLGSTAEHAGRFGEYPIERRHLGRRSREQCPQDHLACAVAPDLA